MEGFPSGVGGRSPFVLLSRVWRSEAGLGTTAWPQSYLGQTSDHLGYPVPRQGQPFTSLPSAWEVTTWGPRAPDAEVTQVIVSFKSLIFQMSPQRPRGHTYLAETHTANWWKAETAPQSSGSYAGISPASPGYSSSLSPWMRYKCVSDERRLGIPRISELIQQWLGLISARVCATHFTYLTCNLHKDAASVYRCLCGETRPGARRGLAGKYRLRALSAAPCGLCDNFSLVLENRNVCFFFFFNMAKYHFWETIKIQVVCVYS